MSPVDSQTESRSTSDLRASRRADGVARTSCPDMPVSPPMYISRVSSRCVSTSSSTIDSSGPVPRIAVRSMGASVSAAARRARGEILVSLASVLVTPSAAASGGSVSVAPVPPSVCGGLAGAPAAVLVEPTVVVSANDTSDAGGGRSLGSPSAAMGRPGSISISSPGSTYTSSKTQSIGASSSALALSDSIIVNKSPGLTSSPTEIYYATRSV